MKKYLLLALTMLLMISCYTPTVNHCPLYGKIESRTSYKDKYKYKVWCSKKGKYYYVISDNLYQYNETIIIK